MPKIEKIKVGCFIIAAIISVAFAIGSVCCAVRVGGNQGEVRESEVSAVPKITAVQLPAVSTPPSAVHLPVIPTPEPTPEPTPYNPYASVELTDRELTLLCRMAYSEAGNEPFEGQVAVIQVALNRMMHPKFPNDIEELLFQKNQFCVGDTFTEAQMEAVMAALMGDSVLDCNTDVVFFSMTGRLKYGSYFKTIGGHEFRTYT